MQMRAPSRTLAISANVRFLPVHGRMMVSRVSNVQLVFAGDRDSRSSGSWSTVAKPQTTVGHPDVTSILSTLHAYLVHGIHGSVDFRSLYRPAVIGHSHTVDCAMHTATHLPRSARVYLCFYYGTGNPVCGGVGYGNGATLLARKSRFDTEARQLYLFHGPRAAG